MFLICFLFLILLFINKTLFSNEKVFFLPFINYVSVKKKKKLNKFYLFFLCFYLKEVYWEFKLTMHFIQEDGDLRNGFKGSFTII